jgi:hypothetical protein
VNFTVVWVPAALDELTEIWLLSPDRNAVTGAVPVIDATLGTAPHSAGVELFPAVCEFTCEPLGVEYEVSDADHLVTILAVWDTNFGRPNPAGN